MRIGVIGAGAVGATLATRWVEQGRDVVVGRRDPGAGRPERLGAAVAVADHAGAVSGADVVVLAVPAGAVEPFLTAHGSALNGTVVVDATNRLSGPPMDPANTRGTLHAMPLLAQFAPGASYNRAFSTVAWEVMQHPAVDGLAADLFHSGPDHEVVAGLIEDLGARAVWVGDEPEAADLIDGATRLWFQLAFARGYGRHSAMHVIND